MVTGTSVETERNWKENRYRKMAVMFRCRGCQKCVVEMFRK
jgi:hypothetical protein